MHGSTSIKFLHLLLYTTKWDVLLEKKLALRVRVRGYDVILMIYANVGICKLQF